MEKENLKGNSEGLGRHGHFQREASLLMQKDKRETGSGMDFA